jgi:hypothetical protein
MASLMPSTATRLRAFKCAIYCQIIIASFTLSAYAEGAVPSETWLSEANKLPFKQQPVGGKLDGRQITFERATLKPNDRFSQKVLHLFHTYDAKNNVKVEIVLPGLADYANRTIAFPTEMSEPLEPLQSRITRFNGNAYPSKAHAKNKNFCQGRVTFGAPNWAPQVVA